MLTMAIIGPSRGWEIFMRTAIAAAVSCFVLLGATATAQVHASIKMHTDIPEQSLGDALRAFANARGVQLIYLSDDVETRHTAGAVGELTVDQALKKLLSGSGLEYRYVDDKTISIFPRANARTTSQQLRGAGEGSATGTPSSIWGQLRLAEAENNSSASPSPILDQPTASSQSVRLEEVVVTAQKREERLQDVPVPVTVVGTEALTQTDQLRIEDYFQKVPGLNILFGGDAEAPIFAIRGITNGPVGAPVVGVAIDDVPYGTATGLGSRGQPNIDPGDLARVEVLRGPQGALYGASTMGGLIKFVTNDPSTDSLSGRVQVGTSTVSHGTGDGYNIRGSVNIPINESTALRASAFRDQEPGYIDDIQSGQKGINLRTSDGGRLALLWRPAEDFSLKLSALVQDAKRDGTDASTVGPGFNDLQIRVTPNTFTTEEKTQAYSATLNAKFGRIELVSLTGYNVDHFKFVDDLARVFGGYFTDCGGSPSLVPYPCGLASLYAGTTGSVELSSIRSRRFSQELRLSVPIGDRFTWLIGGFYTNETDDNPVYFTGADAFTGAPTADPYIAQGFEEKYTEYAAFTNLRYDFTDEFNIQAGGRVSANRQSFDLNRSGPAAEAVYGNPLVLSNLRAKDTPITYLVTPQYKISPGLMAYARFASGYRPGGPNQACSASIACQYEAEKTKNYEVGFKGNFLDHVLSFDTSLYHIDWTNIVVGLSDGVFGYSANAGRAKSQGLELSVEARPFRGLTVSAWVDWDKAEFGGGFPVGGALPGDRLPYSSKFSSSLSVDEELVVNGPLRAFMGASVSYVGERLGGLLGADIPRANLPAYAQTDMHAGLKYETWTVSAFVNNLTNKRGVLDGGLDFQYIFPDPNTYSHIQPRTVGLNVSKIF
jgi:iron complex outermembrane receptor protein